MAIDVDMSGMTAGELADLGAALGCSTFKQVQAKLEAAEAMAKDGDMPLDMLVPMMWLHRRQSDPAFTLEMARSMPFTELVQGLPGPNAAGGETAESLPDSSDRSVRSITSRQRSSGR